MLKRISLTVFLLLFSLFCNSQPQTSAKTQTSNKVVEPMCQEFCEKINKIVFFVVDKTDSNFISRKDIFINKMKKILIDNKKDKYISVDFIKYDTADNYFHPLSGFVSVYIYIRHQEYKNVVTVADIKVITPNQFYVKERICEQNSPSCVDDEVSRVIDSVIKDYLFKPAIGYLK